MSNGPIICCATGVCCPPGSAKQRAALIHVYQEDHPGASPDEANRFATVMIDRFVGKDGALTPLIQAAGTFMPHRALPPAPASGAGDAEAQFG